MGIVIAASVIAFLTTEIDNLAVMVVLFCASDTWKKKVAVGLGRYIGLSLLIMLALFFAEELSNKHIEEKLSLLGFVPILLGIRIGLRSRSEPKESQYVCVPVCCALVSFVLSFIVTVANGGDNIKLYTSFFDSLNLNDFYIFCIVFFIMQTLWCVASLAIAEVKSIREYIKKTQCILVPFLFIVVGIYILLAGGTFMWLFGK
ncbi:MAG: cadmium resistance transporter [Treponema sp.]|nr:cadmium resistance transporter [Treponema sp.]